MKLQAENPAWIEARRAALGWTRRRLAGLAKVTERTVYNIETGRRKPRLATKIAIAQALALGERAAKRCTTSRS